MESTVSVSEVKAHLSRILAQVSDGDEFVITRAGRPVARLVRVPQRRTEPRVPGGWKGRVWMDPDFDELPEDILAAFEGEDESAG